MTWRSAVLHAPRQVLIGLLRAYRLLLSPWIGNQCRFVPSCSVYGIEALERHGALAGSGLTVARLARCHPWCEGGLDPVPHARPRLFTSLLSPVRPAPATDGPDSPEFPSRPLP